MFFARSSLPRSNDLVKAAEEIAVEPIPDNDLAGPQPIADHARRWPKTPTRDQLFSGRHRDTVGAGSAVPVQESPQSRQIVRIDVIDAGCQQLGPHGLSCGAGLVWRRPEPHALAGGVRCGHYVV